MARRALITGMLACAVLVAGAAPTASHPGHDTIGVAVSGYAFKPATVELHAGDLVAWSWDGLDRDHSVTADDGSFDSDPEREPDHAAGDTFVRAFVAQGTFAYHCKKHPQMRGTVVVRQAPAGSQDVVGPSLGRPSALPSKPCLRRGARCRKPGLSVRFVLGEAADVLVEVRRYGRSGRQVSEPVVVRTLRGRAGRNDVRLVTRRLRPGRLRIDVVAADAAGNIAGPRGVTVTLRR